MRGETEIVLLLALALCAWLWIVMPTLRLVFADL
jgi:hypothetical protein